MHDTYIMVDDGLDGEIYVRANNDGIRELCFPYENRYERTLARQRAERYATKEAARLRCDWGTNYND